MKKEKKLDILWLSQQGLMRFKSWFLLKLWLIVIWGFTIFNFYSLSTSSIRFTESPLLHFVLIYLFWIINIVLFLFFFTITILTLRLRKSEFGLYRCCGATRLEISTLILNESLLLASIGFIFLLIIEIFFLLYFKLEIAGTLKLAYDGTFFLFIIKNFIFTYLFLFLVLLLCYVPAALYYAFKDPYYIVRY